MDRRIDVLVDEATGKFQVFVDGQQVPFELAEQITNAILAEADAALGAGGIVRESAVEQHRAGGVAHAHVIGEVTNVRAS